MKLIAKIIFKSRPNVKNYMYLEQNEETKTKQLRVITLFLVDYPIDSNLHTCFIYFRNNKAIAKREALFSEETVTAMFDVMNHNFPKYEKGICLGRLVKK